MPGLEADQGPQDRICPQSAAGNKKLLISANADQEFRFVAGEGFEPPTSGVCTIQE